MKTTTKDYNEFKKWVTYYMKAWGLNDYTVHFQHVQLPQDSIAQSRSEIVSRGVTFRLSKEFDGEHQVKRIAKHEVVHCLVASLSNLVGSFCSEDEYRSADEALVCRLTNLLED